MVGLMADPTMETTCPGVENEQGFSADNNQVPVKRPVPRCLPPGRCMQAAGHRESAYLFAGLRGCVAGYQISIVGDVVGEQYSQPIDIITPVAMEFASHAEPGH